MNLQTVNSKMEVLINERLRLQRAYSAASSMMFQLQIPEGNHLCFALEQSTAKTNREAIAEWILDQVSSLLVDDRSYRELTKKLSGLLNDYERASF